MKTNRLVEIKRRDLAIRAITKLFTCGATYAETIGYAETFKLGDFARSLFDGKNELFSFARWKSGDSESFSFAFNGKHPSLAGQTQRDGRQHDVLSKKMQRTTVRQLAASAVCDGFAVASQLNDSCDTAGENFSVGKIPSQLESLELSDESLFRKTNPTPTVMQGTQTTLFGSSKLRFPNVCENSAF